MRCFKKSFKQFMALFMIAVLFAGSVPGSVNAQEAAQRVYTHEGYEIVYSVSDRWNSSRNINVTVSNTGGEDICGWAISFVPGGEIYSIWDARVVSHEDGENHTEDRDECLIRSESYNGRIPAGGSISFGYQLEVDSMELPTDSMELQADSTELPTDTMECLTDSMEFPEDMKLCAEKAVLPEEVYTVSLNIGSDWQTGVVGEMVLQNTGEEELYFWELAFDTNVRIDSVWNAELSENPAGGHSCLVKACDNTAVIAPGGEVKIGFSAAKDAGVQPMIENVSLSHTSIQGSVSGGETGNEEPEDPEKPENPEYPEDSETDFYEKIAEVMKRYDETTYDLDTDGDGLRDCEEEIIGTDLHVPDTDGDSLSDYDEVYRTYTDPLVSDSAVPGCPDGEADSDGDGILNIVEAGLGTNPLSADTDGDGITDGDEINIHGTNPVLTDTDGDGIEDGHELVLGFDPLKKDSNDDGIPDGETLFTQETEAVFENNIYISKVHVTAEAGNLFPEVTTIEEIPQCLNEDFERVGVFGTPVEISTYSDIGSARISFYLKEGVNVNDYVVLWFDEENSRFVECDTEYDETGGTVSANTTHFSIYFLASKVKWSQALKDYHKNAKCSFETVLVVDCSESMSVNDATYVDFTFGFIKSTRRKDICQSFFGKVNETNKQGVVFFNNGGTVLAGLGSGSTELSSTLELICNSYNTNISTALGVALDEVLSSTDKNALKSIVLISDGGTEHSGDILSHDREVLERAKRENVRIYTVALGDGAVTENMEEIADVTDGAAFAYTYNSASAIADAVFAHQAYRNYIGVTPSARIKTEDILGSEAYLKKLRKRAPLSSLGVSSPYSALCRVKVNLMMDDYYAYSRHGNPDDISDERWDAYCTEFNEAVRGVGSIKKEEIHYFRNELNRAPATRDELIAEKENWKLLSIVNSLYHMYGEDGLFNTKFVSRGDGRYEGVYDKDGLLLTEENDPINMGTYNYCGPTKNFVVHYLLDVVTYNKWGNVKGHEYMENPRSMKDFYDNQEAQDAYKEIEMQMKSK